MVFLQLNCNFGPRIVRFSFISFQLYQLSLKLSQLLQSDSTYMTYAGTDFAYGTYCQKTFSKCVWLCVEQPQTRVIDLSQTCMVDSPHKLLGVASTSPGPDQIKP